MNILIACDSYKETLEASEVVNTIEHSFKKVFPHSKIKKESLSDGGEGTVKALVNSLNGKFIETKVQNPLGKIITSYYGIINDKTAVIEMATASGLELLEENEKNPLITSTYGFGELINHALEHGIKDFILAIGGSATNDAGVGMLQALGCKFYNKNKKEIPQGAQYISDIVSMDISVLKDKFDGIQIHVACDVNNPLCGEFGATKIFGPQKGATIEMIEVLENNLSYFAQFCEKELNVITQNVQGAGAAGGLGFALITFLNASLKSGIDLIMSYLDIEEDIKNSDLIITGEGKMDNQSIHGKAPVGLASIAKKYDKKVIAINGCLGENYEKVYDYGIDSVFSCTQISCSFKEIQKNAKKNLELTSYNIAKSIKLFYEEKI